MACLVDAENMGAMIVLAAGIGCLVPKIGAARAPPPKPAWARACLAVAMEARAAEEMDGAEPAAVALYVPKNCRQWQMQEG
jgi:hypothetical protein